MIFGLDFKNYVTKLVSKSPSRQLVGFQGNFEITEKEKLTYSEVLLYLSIFQCTGHQGDFGN